MEEKRRHGRQQLEAALECPRCGSRNTKFCYYNNYNTAQPRHFCRDCHRYWTQGGALRNIPAPGETAASSGSRKRSRRVTTTTSASPGPSSKVPRVNTGMPGAALAALGMPPPPPPPLFFGAGFPLRPTLSLFNQGFGAGLRGFQPFNHLIMPPPPPQPVTSLSLPLLRGLGMNQVLSVSNAGDGSGTDDHAHAQDQDHGNINGGDLFVNQFFTRFNESDVGGDQARFNAAAADCSSNLQPGVASTGTEPTATGSPAPPPASFI